MKKLLALVLTGLLLAALVGCGAEKPSVDYDLNAELKACQESYDALIDRVKTEDLNQTELNSAAGEMYELWDQEVTALVTRLEEVKGDIADQEQWVASRQQAMDEAGAAVEGGTMQPMLELDKGAALSRSRAYELAQRLGKLVGQQVEAPAVVYEGDYLDCPGGQEIYSELVIKKQGESYAVTMGLCDEKAVLEGTATLEKDGSLSFTDTERGVSGTITVTEDGAVFTVSDSHNDAVAKGEIFNFPEKVD